MPDKSLEQLGSLQRAVMEVLWKLNEATVHQVIEKLPGDKTPAYTTILTVMQKLEKSGWVTHRPSGRAYIYMPKASREHLEWSRIRQSIRKLFKGDVRVFMQHLIDEEQLSDEDLTELRRLIDQRRKERKNG